MVWPKGKSRSEETKGKIKFAMRGHRHPRLGKKHSEETKRKIGLKSIGRRTMLGKHHSDETKNKLKLWIRTKDYREKLRLSAKNRKYSPRIGKNEEFILSSIEKSNNIKLKKQYPVCGYFIDGYNKNLNIAIEIDEWHHKLQSEKDKFREKEIINRIGCSFLRIKDY